MRRIWVTRGYIYADRSSFDELVRLLLSENPVDVVGQPCQHNGETTQTCNSLLLKGYVILQCDISRLENNAADVPDQRCNESLL